MTVLIHQAGPWNPDTWEQRCALCGALLAHQPKDPLADSRALKTGPYVEGSLIERGNLYQAMSLRAQEPTCSKS
jgi:hypothetical protein